MYTITEPARANAISRQCIANLRLEQFQERPPRRPLGRPGKRITTAAEDFVLHFGKHKGRTLGDIFEQEPLYLDWLGSQEYLYPQTKAAVKRFLELPEVDEKLTRMTDFHHFDRSLDHPLAPDRPTFQVQEQTARKAIGQAQQARFMYDNPKSSRSKKGKLIAQTVDIQITMFANGKPTFLKTYDDEQPTPFDPDTLRMKPQDQPEQPDDPKPITRPGQAWRLAATLLDWFEQAETVEDIHLPPQAKDLHRWLPKHTMNRLRKAYSDLKHQSNEPTA